MAPGYSTRNLGMCPDWEQTPAFRVCGMALQTTEPPLGLLGLYPKARI